MTTVTEEKESAARAAPAGDVLLTAAEVAARLAVSLRPLWRLAAAGQFAYTTNAGSGSIGRFSVARDGSLSLTGTTTLGAGSHPLDEGVSRDQDFLYVLVDGFHEIVGYRVQHDGGLTQVTSLPVPSGAAGIGAS